ncbi:MAG TPA: 3'(2'),5'-bisphosphate nucleotidase CysQ [Steroidobacteraceae bacterium]|nr:3'(2'),5'-bisphosphate nucleotidase CysQ [Steroidobacteraceae bacterium]
MSLEALIAIAEAAGREILAVYATDFTSRAKQDASPVTEADERAEALILQRLRELTPDVPIVSEEAHAAGVVPRIGERFWLVDPLDGTKEFISRNGEFTVNVALIEQQRPVLGVVHAPVLGRSYAGRVQAGAFVRDGQHDHEIHCRRPPEEGVTVVSSRSHGDPDALARFLAGREVAASRQAGSSLKFCLLAAGEADLYPRFGRTMEWDTAAGQAVLVAAGGHVTDLDGAELLYGKQGFANPQFVAFGLR